MDGMASQSAGVPFSPIETPCVQVCEIEDTSGLCKGCNRTLAEVAVWGTLTAAMRRQIIEQLPRRRGGAPVARPAAGLDAKGRSSV